MSVVVPAAVLFAGVGISVWVASFILEAIRPAPKLAVTLRWAPQVRNELVEVAGNRLRFIKTGQGPGLVLLHTLRTQLDVFEKVVPELSQHFTVYALDLPGHGFSDIPKARYDAAFFTKAVEGFLDRLDLRDVTLAGVSIGGSIALIIAARRNPRVARVIAINPYDYAKGRGMARSSVFGWLVMYASLLPLVGETVMRLRNFLIMRAVLRGGVVDPRSIPPALMKEMYATGNRPGHYRAFLSLLRHAESWQKATKDYGRIDRPAMLIWGDRDWAFPSEREYDEALTPAAEVVTVGRGGHFLPLDRPRELTQAILRFTTSQGAVA